jgi:lipoate-protein ligase A
MVNRETSNRRWRLLDLSFPSAHQNLALEEALARTQSSKSLSTIRIWTNPRAVVVGRFQEVSAEVDVTFCHQNNIEIVRRFTGGGAVFHDEGNLNLTIVTPGLAGISLARMNQNNCKVILNFLQQLGALGKLVPPSSIEISGKKVSGAAAALGRDFAFWHASILISTNEQTLNFALLPSRTVKTSKFIHSKWQTTITLDSALGVHVKLDDAKRELIHACEKSYQARLDSGHLSTDEEQLSQSLYVHKYSSREWNLQGSCS